jgi:Fur family ferric uptake transcriptional regulator
MKPTRQRTAVAAALASLDGFTSAQSLHEVLRTRGESVGLTTVYRHLQALAEAGEVDALRTDDGETVYRQCRGEEHHHHLVCRTCGATVEVEGPAVEAWAVAIAEEHGYRDVSHTLEVFGTCSNCP